MFKIKTKFETFRSIVSFYFIALSIKVEPSTQEPATRVKTRPDEAPLQPAAETTTGRKD